MLTQPLRIATISLGIGALLLSGISSCQLGLSDWRTVVNNGRLVPDTSVNFNSYGQPALNDRGLVVFRGRGGTGGQPERGIYTLDMSSVDPLIAVARVGSEVPQPNNTDYNGELATFNEFPSIPRIDAASDTVATRGQSQPVWTFLLPDATESRVGTAGIYANPGGTLLTGASLVGAVRDPVSNELVFPEFQVPGATEGTRFDQFPGSPAVTGGSIVVFKGNYTDGVSLTGVFYRDTLAEGGLSPVQLLARAGDPVPGAGGILFTSTSPPSAAAGHAVFIASDNEDAPTAGGIYRAPLTPSPELETLVAIGSPVPVEYREYFTKFGEGLSISTNGRHVAFWGSWGEETQTIVLECPTDGNTDLLAYCNEQYPNGFETAIPVHQGVFVYDTVTGRITPVAKTGQDGIENFLYWVFSGRPPGVGGGEEEETEEGPRWRSSAFASVATGRGSSFDVVFKAKRGVADGIYLRRGSGGAILGELGTVIETGQLATLIDPEAPVGALVTAVGLEREGLRNGRLAVTASMLLEGETEEETEGWAGIYVTRVTGEGN